MSKRKYKIGKPIRSLEALFKQDVVFEWIPDKDSFPHTTGQWKCVNKGWFQNYQFRYVVMGIKLGLFHYVIKENKDENNKIANKENKIYL